MRAAVSPEVPGIILSTASDIRRLSSHLLTHWTLPRVQFRIGGPSSLASQRAQDRFARLYDGCNCVLGELLGAATLVGGLHMVWISGDFRGSTGWVLVAAVCLALIGKGMELAWVRMRLLLALRDLRRRTSAGEECEPAAGAPSPAPVQPLRRAINPEGDGVVHRSRVRPQFVYRGPRRPSIALRTTADINRLVRRLAILWTLPRIELRLDALPLLDLQRAQLRVVRLAGPSSYFPAALLAVAVLLGGLLKVVWTESQSWFYSEREDWWLLRLDWSDVQPVVIGALCAALAATVMEASWKRVRLLLLLRGLRRRMEQLVDA
jgi:hypothetical protein